jgi:DNA (cytosine-5)-methyltransferase 1
LNQLVLSLFPGIGLLDRAFEEEGFTVVRGPDVIWGGDIRSFHPPEGKFDGIIGGPPCQTFSALANLVRASGREPRFGNLIPEFERCVSEALPAWFLMENVPNAPEPFVFEYGVKPFLLNNAWLGEEQRRERRFSFGLLGRAPPNLMRWIEQAALELPRSCGVVSQCNPNNSQEAKGRVQQATVTRRMGVQAGTLVAGGGRPPGQRTQVGPSVNGDAAVRMARYTLADACRLQGLPENFLDDAPFTAQGKLKAVANGVPIPMGHAVARAVKQALGLLGEGD